MGNNRRYRGHSMEERVWNWLRRQPRPMRQREVREHFGYSLHAASKVLTRLVRKGSAVRIGATHAVQYTATDVRPDDMRGTAVNTIQNLRRHAPKKQSHKARRAPRRMRETPLKQLWIGIP